MAQYIDKSALVAEIERRKQKLLDHIICESDIMEICEHFFKFGAQWQKQRDNIPASEDFEKVLEDKIREAQCWTYIEEEGCECPIYQEFGADDLEKFARWGAGWQKRQILKSSAERTL